MKPKVTFERISLSFVPDQAGPGLDVHGLIVPRGVEPNQLCDRDRHPHRVRPLGLHDVRHRADQVLKQGNCQKKVNKRDVSLNTLVLWTEVESKDCRKQNCYQHKGHLAIIFLQGGHLRVWVTKVRVKGGGGEGGEAGHGGGLGVQGHPDARHIIHAEVNKRGHIPISRRMSKGRSNKKSQTS